jgi:hypothetical protein
MIYGPFGKNFKEGMRLTKRPQADGTDKNVLYYAFKSKLRAARVAIGNNYTCPYWMKFELF